jgi:large subunit ribosomal protein L25
MAGERVRLEVKEREQCGSRPSRRLRREGLVPGVLYGSGKPRAFFVDERELRKALGGEHGIHAILDVVLDGQQTAHHAVLKDRQLDPRRSALLHVDLHEVRLDRPIQAPVTVELVGEPYGVSMGGLLSQIIREVTVESLPMSMPDRLELDVSSLDIGDQVRVSDLVVPEDATVIDELEAVVATVAAPRRMDLPEDEVAEEEIEGEGEGEGEEAEGEDQPEAAAESESETSE